jgi:hypothetical protein
MEGGLTMFVSNNTAYDLTVDNLRIACANNGIKTTIRPHLDGYIVYFDGHPGDAAIHSGTYGHEADCFETYGMPWDHGDVTGWLTIDQLIYALLHGELEEDVE